MRQMRGEIEEAHMYETALYETVLINCPSIGAHDLPCDGIK
jgi:hypothetical protein